MNQLGRSILIKFLTQTVDVHLYQVGLAVKVTIPHMLDDFAAGNQLRSAQQKKLEESEFFGGKGNDLLPACRPAAVTIESQVSVAQLGVATMEAAPNQRSHPRQEFCQDKRLGEIVVSAGIQSLHSLLDQTPSREHHDGSLYPSLAQLAADFDPAKTRQPDVEEDGVVRNICPGPMSLLAGFNHVHGVCALSQGACDEAGHLSFV